MSAAIRVTDEPAFADQSEVETCTVRQRSVGRVAIDVARMGRGSVVTRVAEGGPSRLRLPSVRDGAPEGVIINTAGGLASGDSITIEASLGPEAELVLTGAAAEKVYRSTGPTTHVATRLVLGERARLDWLPQETILFDRCRFRRRLDVDLPPSASALLFEATVFGRQASGESLTEGLFEDRWRVRRGGRLVYADTFRLDGRLADLLVRPTIVAGNRALGTMLYLAPDAEARIEEARECLADSLSECGASAWNGLLAVRWVAPSIGVLHRDVARFMTRFRARPLPRVWNL